MITRDNPPLIRSELLAGKTADIHIPELFGQVYESAPTADRGRLLEQLLYPLGVLSLCAVAGGVFARARFRGGWPQLRIRLEDLRAITSDDVVALVAHVQQVSVETVDGLARMLADSPMLAGSAAAALLATLLVQRARRREFGPLAESPPAPH